MSLLVKQQDLIQRYLILPTPQERLNALVDRTAKVPALSAADKIEEHRVHGCQSKVYILGTLDNGLCRFRADADSVIVRALVLLLSELYNGATPSEVIETELVLLSELGLWSFLSPTRQNGLRHVRLKVQDLAHSLTAR